MMFRPVMMYHSPNRGHIRPKFSSMPRQKSEAAVFLDSYKLTVEKKRLQQELDSLNQRRSQIMQRLAIIDRTVEELDSDAQTCRVRDTQQRGRSVTPSQNTGDINTFFVDYYTLPCAMD